MNRHGQWPSIALLIVALVLLSGTLSAASEGDASKIAVGSQEGMKAPDFTLPLLDGDGERINLYEQVEKYDVILLYFFFAAQ